MPKFRFYQPIEVRYGDLDPQGHVNNAKYLTYLEQARFGYLNNLGLMKINSFLDVSIILAEVRVTYLTPILLSHKVRVGVRVTRIGNKSIVMDHHMIDDQNRIELATCTSILVAYDYRSGSSIPVPDDWRQVITDFEEQPLEPVS